MSLIKKLSIRVIRKLSALSLMSSLTLTPFTLHADCLPSTVPDGYQVPFVLSTHNARGIVSFAAYTGSAAPGLLTASSGYNPIIHSQFFVLSGDGFGHTLNLPSRGVATQAQTSFMAPSTTTLWW